jgi:hypothetical protein
VSRWDTISRRILGPLAALALAVYFFRLTRGSLHGFLSPDDITNLHRAWSYPLSLLVRANLLFYETSPFYRPIPSAWYRVIFHFAGLNPVPYHAVNLLLLGINIFLTYAVARRLSGSRETGCLAALLAAYHTQFNGLYFDTAFIFDVLCYGFYFGAFLCYLRIRQAGRFPGAAGLAACSALCIAALNSKEMAVTLPLFLLLFELVYHAPADWRPAALARWIRDEGRGTLATGILTLLFVIGRTTGEYSLARMTVYRPVFTWDRFIQTSRQFLGDLFFVIDRFTPATVLLLWAVLAVIAWASRSRTLRFAWLFLMLSPLPIAFVEPRGAAQYYVPLFGWALYFATLLSGIAGRLTAALRGTPGLWLRRMQAPLLFTVLLLFLYPRYKALGWSKVASVTVDGEMLRHLAADVRALHPTLPQGARLLLLNESADPAWDNLLALARLNYRDDLIRIDRAARMDRPPGEKEVEIYDYVLAWRDGKLIEIVRPPDPHINPVLCATADGHELYHPDWSLVSPRHPARRGEILIAKAKGLGATSPDVPEDHPFPADPLASVTAHVEVKLNGLRAEILNTIGWPREINTYRVDFRIPQEVRPGSTRLELSVRGVTSPPVELLIE